MQQNNSSFPFSLLVISLALFFITPPSEAKDFEQWSFSSNYDFFTIKNKGGNLTYKGKPVSFGPFEKFLYLFDENITGSCQDLPTKADTTVKAKAGKQTVVRHFFFQQKIVSDGKNCVSVQGDGIFYTPIHRSWFSGKQELGINLGEEFKILRDGDTFMHFKKEDGEWHNQLPGVFPNYVFVNEFVKNMKRFQAKYRAHEGISQIARTSFKIEANNKIYSFYLIANHLWALKYPNGKWLITCEDWAFMREMSDKIWKSRHGEVLSKLLNKTLSVSDRKAALYKLGRNWDQTIKESLHEILLDSSDDDYLKGHIIKIVKLKPSNSNMRALAKALENTNDRELQEEITQALRVRNPDGPKISAEDNDSFKVEEKIKKWKTWASELK